MSSGSRALSGGSSYGDDRPARRHELSSAMKAAIMQPYFLPYIGYFQLINGRRSLHRVRQHQIHEKGLDQPQPHIAERQGRDVLAALEKTIRTISMSANGS